MTSEERDGTTHWNIEIRADAPASVEQVATIVCANHSHGNTPKEIWKFRLFIERGILVRFLSEGIGEPSENGRIELLRDVPVQRELTPETRKKKELSGELRGHWEWKCAECACKASAAEEDLMMVLWTCLANQVFEVPLSAFNTPGGTRIISISSKLK